MLKALQFADFRPKLNPNAAATTKVDETVRVEDEHYATYEAKPVSEAHSFVLLFLTATIVSAEL